MPYPPGPFLGTEALAQGRYTRRTLARRAQPIYRNVYLPEGEDLTPASRAVAAWLWSGRQATVAGSSAAALHGTRWIGSDEPAELTRTNASSNDIVVHRERLTDDEVCTLSGMSVTTPARTAFDVGRRGPLRTALMRLDALAHATGLTSADVTPVIAAHRGARGIVGLREAIDSMDGGAESPQETRTRLVLLRAGMRRPVTQIEVVDDYGHVFARIDMGWPDLKVGVEYDGEQHWTDARQRSHDIDRYAVLADRRWAIIRVSAELLRYRPWVIVERVLDALRTAHCPWLAECSPVSRFSRYGVA
ncbi:hypothetical protein [Mycolicibacterium sediminis]|uniref:DUF559 domain-containing protein n=1 Tax=Mycolicibacterium sediminis TaxID=1286180 RepID=A0A7I7QJY5_9MYCO|nr:hypothetical protein [Mycolicibacterium sediminis]BBY26628.1 hypothetical protein MSEDJ_07240 [Mycolicibacterium sediminis]